MNAPHLALNTHPVTPRKALPDRASLYDRLTESGWALLRGYEVDIEKFGGLISELCPRLTFDPARDYASEAVQVVDAGQSAVGLHIENGNTPLPPEVVSFYSARSTSRGSQTTACDGVAVLGAMSAELKKQFTEPFTMTRYLPKVIWQRYVATALGIESPDAVDEEHLATFIALVPGQSCTWADEQGIDYTLAINAIREDNFAGAPAFANALLGPSYNYETPTYRFSTGEVISTDILAELAALGEEYTQEIDWQDGDIVVIDNKRVMHGRRAIEVPLLERELFIAMGRGRYNVLDSAVTPGVSQ